jgi:hypothetical protein
VAELAGDSRRHGYRAEQPRRHVGVADQDQVAERTRVRDDDAGYGRARNALRTSRSRRMSSGVTGSYTPRALRKPSSS